MNTSQFPHTRTHINILSLFIIFGLVSCNSSNKYDINDTNIQLNNCNKDLFFSPQSGTTEFCHLSIDDTLLAMDQLKNSDAESIWDIEYFSWLKSLNDIYGTKVSLYCQDTPSLINVKDKWKDELKASSKWLKFGFHNNTHGQAFNANYEDAKQLWSNMRDEVQRFTGTLNCLDRCPRLDYFSGSKDALLGMRDADFGAVGFLCDDDSRDSYYLSREANDYLDYPNDAIIDSESGLTFFKTDYRFDWLKPEWKSNYTPNWTPREDNSYSDIELMYNTPRYKDSFRNFIMFCHEVEVFNNHDGRKRVEDACRWCHDNGLTWAFPQERTPAITRVF